MSVLDNQIYSTLRDARGVEIVRTSLGLETWKVQNFQHREELPDLAVISRYALAAYVIRNHGFTDDPRVITAVKELLWYGTAAEASVLTVADLINEMRDNRFYQEFPEGKVEFGPFPGGYYYTVAVDNERALIVSNILKFGVEIRLLAHHAKRELERIPAWPFNRE